jgi:hypothetical protein
MNYQWNVVQMDRLTSDGFVVTVHYTVNAVDGDYTASTYGTVGYTQGEGSYVPFANLTKEQVIGWAQDSLNKETVEAALSAQIDAQKNPVQASGLPW